MGVYKVKFAGVFEITEAKVKKQTGGAYETIFSNVSANTGRVNSFAANSNWTDLRNGSGSRSLIPEVRTGTSGLPFFNNQSITQSFIEFNMSAIPDKADISKLEFIVNQNTSSTFTSLAPEGELVDIFQHDFGTYSNDSWLDIAAYEALPAPLGTFTYDETFAVRAIELSPTLLNLSTLRLAMIHRIFSLSNNPIDSSGTQEAQSDQATQFTASYLNFDEEALARLRVTYNSSNEFVSVGVQ